MSKGKRTNAITKWLYNSLGLNLTFIANKYNKDNPEKDRIETIALYNFVKGLTKRADIQELLLSYDVPLSLIEHIQSEVKNKKS